jgi:hypothetical protein
MALTRMRPKIAVLLQHPPARHPEHVGTTQNGDQHVARWPARAEFVRRATSPTSVGQAEPATDLLGGRIGTAPKRRDHDGICVRMAG